MGSAQVKRGEKAKGKKIVKRPAEDVADDEDAGPGAKRSKAEAGEEPPSAELPVPDADWAAADLEEAQRRLNNMAEQNDAFGLCYCLDRLAQGGRVTVELLQATGVGKDVRVLKKHAAPEVAAKAAAVVALWKRTVGS